MNEKRVIVMGRPKSGKSWFLNQLLGRREFSESVAESPESRIETRRKAISDRVNQLEYTLVLSKVPGLGNRHETRIQGLENAITHIKSGPLNQIVLIFKMALPLESELVNYLKTLSLLFKGQNMSAFVTLAINQIASSARDEDIIQFQRQIKRILCLDASKECICIRVDEPPRECVFRYLVHTPEDGFQFQDRNFLMVVGQSNAKEMDWLMPPLDPKPDPGDSDGMPMKLSDVFFHWAPRMSTIGYLLFYIKIFWGDVKKLEFAIGLSLMLFQHICVIQPCCNGLQKLKRSLPMENNYLNEVLSFLRSPPLV